MAIITVIIEYRKAKFSFLILSWNEKLFSHLTVFSLQFVSFEQ